MSTLANTSVGPSLFVEAVTSANSVGLVMSSVLSVPVRHVTDAETCGPLEHEIASPAMRVTSAVVRRPVPILGDPNVGDHCELHFEALDL